MEIRDYNGTGRWSSDSVLERYRSYAQELGILPDENIAPRKHTEGDVMWIYPIMDAAIAGIERGDKACLAIGIEALRNDGIFMLTLSKTLRIDRFD